MVMDSLCAPQPPQRLGPRQLSHTHGLSFSYSIEWKVDEKVIKISEGPFTHKPHSYWEILDWHHSDWEHKGSLWWQAVYR